MLPRENEKEPRLGLPAMIACGGCDFLAAAVVVVIPAAAAIAAAIAVAEAAEQNDQNDDDPETTAIIISPHDKFPFSAQQFQFFVRRPSGAVKKTGGCVVCVV